MHSIFRAQVVMPEHLGRQRDQEWVERTFPGALISLEDLARRSQIYEEARSPGSSRSRSVIQI